LKRHGSASAIIRIPCRLGVAFDLLNGPVAGDGYDFVPCRDVLRESRCSGFADAVIGTVRKVRQWCAASMRNVPWQSTQTKVEIFFLSWSVISSRLQAITANYTRNVNFLLGDGKWRHWRMHSAP
jgi:hypothetical protein